MTEKECHDINRSRLAGWSGELAKEHYTPMILVGIGHDHVAGEIHVVAVAEVPNEALSMILQAAAERLALRP